MKAQDIFAILILIFSLAFFCSFFIRETSRAEQCKKDIAEQIISDACPAEIADLQYTNIFLKSQLEGDNGQ